MKQNSRGGKAILIGLTGGIAAGKSTVLDILRRLGAEVIDADAISREVVLPGTEGSRLLREAFGGGIFPPDGRLNRARLAALTFDDDENYATLTGILYPLIRQEIAVRVRLLALSSPDSVIVLDAPMLIESGCDSLADEVWVVTAPEKLRVDRACARDRIAPEQVLSRSKRQLDESARLKRADRVIDNSSSFAALEEQVKAHWQSVIERRP